MLSLMIVRIYNNLVWLKKNSYW